MFDVDPNTINLFSKYIKGENFHVIWIDPLFEKNMSDVKKALGKDRAKILIVNHEPNYYYPKHNVAQQFIELKNILLDYQIFNCDFYITCYMSDNCHNDTINYLNENFYDWKFHKFCIDIPLMGNWTLNVLDTLDINNESLYLEECKMKFCHLNYTHRMHRQLFSKFLIKENLVKNNLISINDGVHLTSEKLNYPKKVLGKPFHYRSDWFYSKKLLDLWREVPLEFNKHPDTEKGNGLPFLKFIHKASINIISETVFDYPYPYYTEKTVQAILSKRPFICIGSAGNLQNLKEKGFKTFASEFNEDYDTMTDPNQRLEAIMQLVLELNKKSQQELIDMCNNMEDTLIHNYKLMLQKIKHFTNSPN